MSRKSRRRMMEGRTEARTGQVVYGHQDPQGRSRAAMLGMLAAAEGDEREAIRQHLREDGGVRALALLSELEKRWAQRPAARSDGG